MRAERNVQHHYDIDNELFQRFLDPEMQYSCAYFEREDMSLDEAQRAKLAHIGRKLLLEPGQKVLDIGCGWGGMALFLAREYDVDVVGLTLSDDQYRTCPQARRGARAEPACDLLKEDYREHQGAYDAIVSVGMFEHVGRPQYQTFFDQVARLLKPDGRSLIHFIARNGMPPKDSRTWIQKYIFPGGYIPSLSDFAPCIEKTGMSLAGSRGLAPALCAHTGGMERALPGTARRVSGAARRTILPHVGVLSAGLRSDLSLRRTGGLSRSARASERRRAGDA